MRISDWSSDVCSSDLAEKHRAVMVVGIEPVAQQIGRGLRDQETYLRARRAAEGAAQQIGDEARGALCGLERDVTRKAVAHDHVDLAARPPVARSKERRVGKECFSTRRARGWT